MSVFSKKVTIFYAGSFQAGPSALSSAAHLICHRMQHRVLIQETSTLGYHPANWTVLDVWSSCN